MKFFEQQKIDDIGILGVKLQKILIFLSIVNLVSFIQVSVVTLVCGLSMQVILASAFYGAYKRRIGLLRFYVAINIILIIIAAIAIGISLSGPTRDYDSGDSDVSQNSVPSIPLSNPKPLTLSTPNSAILSLNPPIQPIQQPTQQSSPIGLLPLSSPKPLDLHIIYDDTDSATYGDESSICLFSIGLLVFCLVIFALKLASILMCAKMARMLMTQRATNLAHPVVKAPTQMNAVTPPIHAPQHPQVMYIPINMAQSMNSNMYGPYMQSIYPMYNPYLQPQFQAQYPQVQFGNLKQQV